MGLSPLTGCGAIVVVLLVALCSYLYELTHPDIRYPSLLMPPVTFSILKWEYLKICVGEPCKWLRFKIDRSSTEILLHPGAQSFISSSYWSSLNSDAGSEFFYFDNVRLRLPVRQAAPVLLGYADEWIPDGTLGLAYGSPLWLYWDSFTIGSKRLYLGQYQYYAQEDPFFRPPVFFFDESTTITMGDGFVAPLVFDFHSPDSLVPWECDLMTAFQRIEIRSSGCRSRYGLMGIDITSCDDVVTIYPSQYQKILLASKVEYMAIDYSDDGKVHLGSRFFWEVATHFDWRHGCFIISPDIYSLDYAGFGMTASLCIIFALFLWPILVTSHEALNSEFQFLLIILLEFFCYTIDIIALLVSFTMLNWRRFITQFAERSDWLAIIYIVGFVFIGLAFTIYQTGLSHVPYFHYCEDKNGHLAAARNYRKMFPIRFMLFCTAQIAVLWLLMVEEHEPTLDQAILMYFLSLLLFLQTVIIANCYITDRYLQMSFGIITSIMTVIFTVFYSLFPFMRYSDIHHNFYLVAAAWLILLVWSPAIICTVLYEIDGHKRRRAMV